ncbi:MAG: hypothetical protein VX768_14155 [Planctomycetota bacterium]|nr:hypothetical protein [Planctomycetota bacterium]
MKSVATGVCFRLPELQSVPRGFESYIYGEWIDRNPLPVQVEIDGQSLIITYNYKESLRIIIPWQVEGLGVFFLKTVSLPKVEAPYDLLLELARGTVGRLVDQTENWKASGLVLPVELEDQLALVKQNFRQATFSEGERRNRFAEVAIGAAIHLMNEVGTVFAKYVFERRKKEKQPSSALIAAPFYSAPTRQQTTFQQVFNSALVSDAMSDDLPVSQLVANIHERGLTTCSEPLFGFRELAKSDYASIDELESFLLNDAKKRLESGLSGCKLIYPMANVGFREANGWNDQEQIHLVYELFSGLKNSFPKIPLIVGIDQPFGESQVSGRSMNPLQLADNLIRMETPIAAISLEINMGYYPDGTWIRDLFAFNDLLDSWAQFDYPMLLQLRIPGGGPAGENEDGSHRSAADPDSQSTWLEKISLLAMAKHNVAGVIYSESIDRAGDPFYGAGLISSSMNEKPALSAIRQVRRAMS